MRLYNVRGNLVSKNVSRYIIKWDGPSKSQLQFRVKQFLKPYWKGLVMYEEFPVYGTPLRVDLLNAAMRISIEVNGPQHNSFHYFHNNKPALYLKAIKNDQIKTEWLKKNDFQIVEINFDEVDTLTPHFFLENYKIKL